MYKFEEGYVMPIMTNTHYSPAQGAIEVKEFVEEEIQSEIDVENSFKINDQLFINMSHEIRTPLNIIYGAAQLIELYLKTDDKNKTADKIAANVNTIKQNSYRLMKILNNILDLQKIEAGLFKLNYSYVNVVELVEGVVQGVSENIKDKQYSFIFDTDSEEESMMVDTVNIERVLLNILSNAVKFSYPQGRIYVNLSVKETTIEIAVTDNGIGIEKKHLKNIFNRFGQVDKSISRKTEGSGIGLKLSKELIEAHGGSINVFSKSKRGSTFIIKLPRKRNDTIYTIYSNKVINYDSLNEMIKIEFSDIENMGA